jgi:hypothetical protein
VSAVLRLKTKVIPVPKGTSVHWVLSLNSGHALLAPSVVIDQVSRIKVSAWCALLVISALKHQLILGQLALDTINRTKESVKNKEKLYALQVITAQTAQ